MNVKVSPVSEGKRIALLDILRGLAIFGILMVNMQLFYQPATIMVAGFSGTSGWEGMLSEAFIKFFFEGKFYVLFSMLFGYGFWIFINKSTGEGYSIIPVFRRRLFILLVIGLLHVLLLWPGDILVWYSIFGFILILFRKKSDRSLRKWAIWLALIPVIITAFSVLMIKVGMANPESAEMINASLQEREAYIDSFLKDASAIYLSGSFSEIFQIRLREYEMLLPGVIFFYPMVLAMFLTGVWAARNGIIKNYRENQRLFRRLFIWGFIFGLLFNAIYTYSYFRAGAKMMPDFWMLMSVLFHIAGGFTLSVCYVSATVLLYIKGKCIFGERYLAPVGRMALTNYLLQSIVCTTLFLSYGFGLFGQITAFQGIILTILIFSLQIPFSIIWLKYFNFGPFEWLWRSLTYLKWQPFRKRIDL